MLVRLCAVEHRSLDGNGFPARAERGDVEGDVRRILPVMAERGGGVLSRGGPMHERGGTDHRLTDGRELDPRGPVACERKTIRCRKIHEEVVRVLMVDEGTTSEALARLEQFRGAKFLECPGLEGIHRHEGEAAPS